MSSFEQLVGLVQLLEAGWEEGALLRALRNGKCRALPVETALSYRRRLGEPRPAYRTSLLRQLLHRLQVRLHRPQKVFTGRDPSSMDVAVGPADPSIVTFLRSFAVEHEGVTVPVRFDQALASADWGSWFSLADRGLQEQLEVVREAAAVARFHADWRDLNALPADVDPRSLTMGSSDGAPFERLMRDILNEERRAATLAPLAEDLFEKTDLRVHYRELARPHGARVQVTLSDCPHLHVRKLRAIHRVEEYVVLSPLTLAVDAWSRPSNGSEKRAVFFDCFTPPPRSPEDLARRLRVIFQDAMQGPPTPLGPMLHVPAPIRRQLRRFVEVQAREAHRCWLLRRPLRPEVPKSASSRPIVKARRLPGVMRETTLA